MIRKEFFEVLSESDSNKEKITFTVIEGEGYGEKAIFSEGRGIFFSKRGGFLSSHSEELEELEELSKIINNGIFTLKKSLIYVERIGREKEIVICGAGHVSMPIIRLSKMIDFRVTVIDDRALFVENARLSGADVVICDKFSSALSKIQGDSDTYFVVVTRGHFYDSECLRMILKKPFAYLGMMGSERRVKIVKEGLLSEGYDYEDVKKIHAPIGLAIKAETPEEIAISIMAEIIQVKNRNKNKEFPAEILSYILKNQQEHEILCTIISKRGSGPREIGTKMLCTSEGKVIGTIGGGLMEAKVIKKAEEIFSECEGERDSVLMRVELNADEVSKEGEVCGGVIEILLEYIS